MKRCPKCGKSYSDGNVNFCLEDGELLAYMADEEPATILQNNRPTAFADDGPATEVLGNPRVTNDAGWPGSTPAPWHNQPVQFAQGSPLAQYSAYASPSQSLAVVSMSLGLGAVTVGWCCYIGLLLAPAALITGFIALSQTKSNPQAYSGRGFAIAGIVTGAISIAGYILIILIYGAALFAGALNP